MFRGPWSHHRVSNWLRRSVVCVWDGRFAQSYLYLYLYLVDMFGGPWYVVKDIILVFVFVWYVWRDMVTWFWRICLVGHIRWWVFGCGEVGDGRCAQSCGRELMAELTAVWKASDGGSQDSGRNLQTYIQTNPKTKTKKYLILNRVDGNWWPN